LRTVAALSSVVDSAEALIKGLHDQLVAAQSDPAKLAAVIASLKSKSDELAKAVADNTVAQPATPATPGL
jgi:hypothetical protein